MHSPNLSAIDIIELACPSLLLAGKDWHPLQITSERLKGNAVGFRAARLRNPSEVVPSQYLQLKEAGPKIT
jgi:hypothetical protein